MTGLSAWLVAVWVTALQCDEASGYLPCSPGALMEINSKEPVLRDALAGRKNMRDQKVILIKSWLHPINNLVRRHRSMHEGGYVYAQRYELCIWPRTARMRRLASLAWLRRPIAGGACLRAADRAGLRGVSRQFSGADALWPHVQAQRLHHR